MKVQIHSIGILLALAALCLPLPARAVTAPQGKAELRKLLELPKFHLTFGLEWNLHGFTISGEVGNFAREIAGLKESLQETPGDAPIWARIARLYQMAGQAQRAEEALSRATTLYRQQEDQRAGETGYLVAFGLVLLEAGEVEEAESLLRRAVRLDPDHWRGWSALSRVLIHRGIHALTGKLNPGQASTPEALLEAASRRQASSADLAQARDHIDEAVKASVRAVELAPEESRARRARVLVLSGQGVFQHLAKLLQGAQPDFRDYMRSVMNQETANEFWAAARLASEDATLLGKATLFQLITAAGQIGPEGMQQLGEGRAWSALSEQDQGRIQRGITQLEELGRQPGKTNAAQALVLLGGIKRLRNKEDPTIRSDLRRATTLDPSHAFGWKLLISLLVEAGEHEQALEHVRELLQLNHSPINHVLAAKILEKLGRHEEALQQVEAALKHDPQHYAAIVSAAVLFLKYQTDEASLKVAQQLVQKALKLEGHPASRAEFLELQVIVGILLALLDEDDKAREHFQKILKMDPDNATARKALALIGR